jgi:acyl-coenzyme A thioesterase PaaI-like protein
MTLAPERHQALTVEFKLNFLCPASADRFAAQAKVVKPGKSQSVCQCDIFSARSGEPVSITLTQCTVMNVPVDASECNEIQILLYRLRHKQGDSW